VKSILIVDDNLASLKQISTQLAASYSISLAKSGGMALQICAREKPDLILLDVEMPEMDGFETIARLKEDPGLKDIPVIFLTGNHDAATEVRCLESGAMDFITKPVNIDILSHRIELHLMFSTYQLNLEHTVKELEDNIGIAFAELLDCKDYNVAGHVLRTGIYAELIMNELLEAGTFGNEITAEDIDTVKRAIPFHDIGKIGISDIILLKQSPLSKEEFREIYKHTTIGAQVLKTIYDRTPHLYYMKAAITIAEGHHERYDGTGYPHHLKGDDIPLYCRIMSVANVYDACITDRVYRKKLSHEEACNIILAGRSTEFDPRIVDAFDRIKDKFPSFRTAVQLSLIDKEWSLNK
jgi:putative two-component system response regulator